MEVIYAQEPLKGLVGPSIFLAGPTPRRPLMNGSGAPLMTWRREALRLFSVVEKWSGTLLVPEYENTARVFNEEKDWIRQVAWETKALEQATLIMFWVPRDMILLPGLTTNIEFGMWVDSGKVVLGFPPRAPHTRILAYHAKRCGVPVLKKLGETVHAAVEMVDVIGRR